MNVDDLLVFMLVFVFEMLDLKKKKSKSLFFIYYIKLIMK